MSTATAKRAGRRRLAIPAQHGAWAFLAVPLLLGFLIAGWSLPTVLFAAAWVLAYPASYYLGRAVVIRWRRGTWSRLAKRELTDAVPWMVLATIPAVALVVLRPWLVWVGAVLFALWAVSVWLTRTGHERGASNDLLLVTQAAIAVPLMWGIATDTPTLGLGDAAATVVLAVEFEDQRPALAGLKAERLAGLVEQAEGGMLGRRRDGQVLRVERLDQPILHPSHGDFVSAELVFELRPDFG
mgnify:CR=1 FL=1